MHIFSTMATVGMALLSLAIYPAIQYRKTTYYRITKKSFRLLDAGSYGEYLIYKKLRHHEMAGGKFLFNLYVPAPNGQNSEIDVLLITSKGLFVFESKNFSGWIFGNEAHKNWTQMLPQGLGRSRKISFYNPVMQNGSHITHLRNYIAQDIPIWSIIVFSDRCTLKSITLNSDNVHVTNPRNTDRILTCAGLQTKNSALTAEHIDSLFAKLYPLTQTTPEAKALHANNMREKVATN